MRGIFKSSRCEKAILGLKSKTLWRSLPQTYAILCILITVLNPLLKSLPDFKRKVQIFLCLMYEDLVESTFNFWYSVREGI